MVERFVANEHTRVRFPVAAPKKEDDMKWLEKNKVDVTEMSVEVLARVGIPIIAIVVLVLCFLPGFAKSLHADDSSQKLSNHIERQLQCFCSVCYKGID